jgi:hypothetical protein
VAVEGHKTTCGAALVARTASASARATALVADGCTPADHGLGFDRFFQIKDKKTGIGKLDVPYRITLANGEQILGSTDQHGYTAKVYSDTATTAKLEAPFYGNDGSSENGTPDTSHGPDACGC